MKKNVRQEFIEEIRQTLPKNKNAALYLVDKLGLGKETVYRRLRGSVPFTLDEAARVAADLGISLDHVVGVTSAENAGYEFLINYLQNFDDNFREIMDGSMDALTKVSGDPAGIYIMAANHLPYRFYSPFKALLDFRFKRWLYEREKIESFSADIREMADRYQKIQVKVLNGFRDINGTYMIWDDNVFLSLVKEINYFRLLSMVSDEEVAAIREELLELLDGLETMMVKGRTPEGKRIYFYLSNVIFDTSYSYMEARDFKISYFHIYAVHTLSSVSPQICAVQKSWLQTILRHSTLITQSGEIERSSFLKKQRALVEAM